MAERLGDLESRAAYLSGLIRGLDLPASPEGRILAEVASLVGDLAREVARLSAAAPAEPAANGTPTVRFIACECPVCGEDIFAQAEGTEEDVCAVGLDVTCANCGAVLAVREKPDPRRRS